MTEYTEELRGIDKSLEAIADVLIWFKLATIWCFCGFIFFIVIDTLYRIFK